MDSILLVASCWPQHAVRVGDDILWLILIGHCGRETARVPLINCDAHQVLPLRRVVEAGLRHHAAAVIIARHSIDPRCTVSATDLQALTAGRRTLHAIGMRLHDCILWHGETCVSLRLTGRL